MPRDSKNSRHDGTALPESLVRDQLERLLSSTLLARSDGLVRLLRFIVEETLAGRAPQLKESRLGLEVFDRSPESYDPAVDPIVRVQMGRLRARLRSYYEGLGANDQVLIEVPTGRYVPSFGHRARDARDAADRERAQAPPSESRLAVLPFVNMSPDPNSEYFSDGLTEELINLLARDGRLQVVARTSTFQFKGAARDIRDIGRQLGVGKVLEGSVRKAGNRVRVTAQLINVADGCHLWSERYESEIVDIFAIQEEIAGSIRRALQARLVDSRAEPTPRGGTEGIEAHNHYLQGRFLWNQRTGRGFKAAIDHFDEAIRLDPGFARAHSGLADCYLMLGMSAAEAPERSMPTARTAAMRALELDPGLAEAHASLAAVKSCYEWNQATAENEYQRSFTLDPNYATAHHWHGMFALATSGRLAEAIEQLEMAIQLDPLSQPIIADLGLVHAFRRDPDAAIRHCRRALELDPYFHRPHWFLGLTHAWSGDFVAAEEALRKGLELCPGPAFRSRLMGALGFCYGRWGRDDQAEAILEDLTQLARTDYVPPFELAQVHVGRGDPESAIRCLESAVATRDCYAIFLSVWPSFETLWREPRFGGLLSQVDAPPATLR